jgi:hypothetical protein
MTSEDMRLYQFTINFLDQERREAAARMRPMRTPEAAWTKCFDLTVSP